MEQKNQPRIVIIGAGFGGLHAAQKLASKPVEVLLIDRNNFHTFSPLLYQVATCALDPSAIAYPVRSIFRHKKNVHFMLGDVQGIDYEGKSVHVRTNGTVRHEPYDYLIVAAGSITNYFGQESLERTSFGLKDLDDAVTMRHHILKLFERASWTDDAEYREALTTLVVVGGGPTGLETAGALYELYNHVLKQEYGDHTELRARVILIEAQDHLLSPYPKRLQTAAIKQLQSIGVEVWTGALVEKAAPDKLFLTDGRVIPTYTVVWSAGVKASPLADMLDVSLERGGRIPIMPTTEVIGRESIYAVGDIAHLLDKEGNPYPMLIPVAKQQGMLAANNILREMKGEQAQVFHYIDRGIMATIGRSRAVAWIFYRIQLTGFIAWVAWLFLHLVMLMGFRNRLSAFMNWVWNYITYDRSVRIILDRRMRKPDTISAEQTPEGVVN